MSAGCFDILCSAGVALKERGSGGGGGAEETPRAVVEPWAGPSRCICVDAKVSVKWCLAVLRRIDGDLCYLRKERYPIIMNSTSSR